MKHERAQASSPSAEKEGENLSVIALYSARRERYEGAI
jgi:hypothetical protein